MQLAKQDPSTKLTEVGIIPADWEVRQVSELVRSGPKNGYSGRSGLEASGTATLSLSATTSGKLILNAETVKYLEATIPPDSDLFLKPDDVLVQRSNTIELVGTTAVFTGPASAYIYPDLMMRLRFRSRVLAHWFWRYANSSAGRSYFRSVAAGSTGSMPKLSGDKLRDMPIPLPPTLTEQEAIAAALSDADGLIESLEKLIAKKRQIKHGTMQEFLTGKRRLPGFSGKWETKRLAEFIDLLTGFPFPSKGYSQSGIRLLRGSNVKRNRTDWSDELTQYWPEVTGDIRRYLLRADDIVIAMDGSLVGRSFASLKPNDVPSLLLQRVARVRSVGVSQAYLKEWICSNYFTEHCDAVKTTTAIPHISPADINSFSIPLPPTLAEQSGIAAILSDMDAEIAALEAKLAKARQVKQGMMQELLTGRIRLL